MHPAPEVQAEAVLSAVIEGDGDVLSYALGCVLFEMLAGEPPFTGPNAQAIISKRMAPPAPSISVVRDGTPPEVSQALARALSRSPADRFSTAAEFAKALGARSGEPFVTRAVTAEVQPPNRRSGKVAIKPSGGLLFERRPQPAREADGQRDDRIVQRAIPRRMFERALVRVDGGRAAEDRRVSMGLQ